MHTARFNICNELRYACLRMCASLLVCALNWNARTFVCVCVCVVDGAASVCLAETLDPGMLETGADWSILWRLWPCSAFRMSRERAGHHSSTGDTLTTWWVIFRIRRRVRCGLLSWISIIEPKFNFVVLCSVSSLFLNSVEKLYIFF